MVPDREALALDILADAHRTGKTLTQEEFKEALKEELRHKVDLTRLAGAVTAFATYQQLMMELPESCHCRNCVAISRRTRETSI